jgi:NAD(P)-dependent dehydrogenase (short-subunit alcohol dehydrogenase family)
LGKEYASLLASRGARVVVNDIGGSVTGDGSNSEAAQAAADEIRQHGGQAVADSHSVTSHEGGQAIIDTDLSSWGRVDIVINNAGIVRDTRVLAAEGADHNIKVNAVAPIAFTRMLKHSIDSAEQPADAESQAVLDDLVNQHLKKLDPGLVAPVAASLTHRDCPVTGEIYTVGAEHVSRFVIGRTKGFYNPELSIEDVRDQLDAIRDEAGYTVPGGPADEMSELFATIMAG